MHDRPSSLLVLAAVFVMGPVSASTPEPVACATLAGMSAGNGIVLESIDAPAPLTIGSGFGGQVTLAERACIVRGRIRPTADSDIRFEVWLPTRERWNGRLQTVGNGGNAGTVIYSAMLDSFTGGYATASTDTGHVGAMSDASYALGHPEKVRDFGWRSLEEIPLVARDLIEAYYGRAPEMTIFNGCSTGGRQGLEIAQRFPELYDGIVAGAPASYWPELNALHADFGRFLLADPARWVSQAKLDYAQAAVHEACGGIDGIIDDPEACRFDYAELACDTRNAPVCLTDTEVASLQRRYSDLVDADGQLIYPSFTHGAESQLGPAWMGGSAAERFYGGWTWRYPEGFFANYVHADASWTVREFDLARDLAAAQQGVIGAAVYAQDPDLTRFRESGGKLLLWHGWHDMSIPARNTIRYYDEVLRTMGGVGTVSRFMRLFMGTGVGHCRGGPGPDVIGGTSAPVRDSRHDVVEALVHWITDGEAPDYIVASKVDEDGNVSAQRPWCAYPTVALWDGSGDRRRASSYRCPE